MPDDVRYAEIPDFPGYRVGDDGTIWRAWVNCRWGRRLTDRWRLMKLGVQKSRTPGRRYRYVNLTPAEGGKYRTFRVHRLVLLAFVGPCPEGMEARHEDGDPSNNRLDNLAWGTPAENRADNRRLGRYTSTPRNRMFTHDGRTLCLKDWSEILGIPYACLYQRVIKLGMSFAEAAARPHRGHSSNGHHWTKLKRARGSRPAE